VNVFVDTSGIAALMWKSDKRHREAVATWSSLIDAGARLLTTDWVVAETVTLVRARAGCDLSVIAAERLLAAPFEVVWVERALVQAALVWYSKYRDHALSLCDCVSFAVMRARRVATAFAYDEDFVHVGYRLASN
jgi:uncharacterized protein